jgi:hypothetical protein
MNLKENALFSYESVSNLYLQHCKIVNINEKAFQRLENLTEIDLSSNRLNSVSPNLFNNNQKLDKLILRNNNLGTLQWNTPILNGPSSLSFLDLQSCQLSNISSITFSQLLNLTFLDISRNSLVLLHNDSLSSHENLKDVNLENNPWQCGAVFEGLLCWMHSKLALSHNRTVQCQYKNEMWDIWTLENRSSLCRPITTPLTDEFLTVVTPDLTTVSVGVSLPPKTSPHTSRVVETAVTSEAELRPASESQTGGWASLLSWNRKFTTDMTVNLLITSKGTAPHVKASPDTTLQKVIENSVTLDAEVRSQPERETGGWASLLTWNVTTLAVFVILPITLGAAVFVSLTAVNYIAKRYSLHHPQHHMQGEDNHLAACLDCTVPFLNPQLQVDLTNQPLEYLNRSSESVRHSEYHVYEEIR